MKTLLALSVLVFVGCEGRINHESRPAPGPYTVVERVTKLEVEMAEVKHSLAEIEASQKEIESQIDEIMELLK